MLNKESLLVVNKLNKTFFKGGKENKAVYEVSFNLDKGEIIGLIGESGSGKSTIGRTIMRLHNATSGEITLNGVDISSKKISKENKKYLRKNIQMVFQDPYSSLNEQKNIMNIVSEPIRVQGLTKKLINDVLDNKKNVIKFYESDLKKEFHNLNVNIHLGNLKKINAELKIIRTKINSISLDNYQDDEDLLRLSKWIIDFYFDKDFSVKTNYMSDLSDGLLKSLNFWKAKQEKIKNEIPANASEAKIMHIKNELAIKKESLLMSSDAIKASKAIKNMEKELKDSNLDMENFVVSIKKGYTNSLKELNKDIHVAKKNKINSSQYSEYNYQSLIIVISQHLKNIVRYIKKHKLFIPFLELKLHNEFGKIITNSKKYIGSLLSSIGKINMKDIKNAFHDLQIDKPEIFVKKFEKTNIYYKKLVTHNKLHEKHLSLKKLQKDGTKAGYSKEDEIVISQIKDKLKDAENKYFIKSTAYRSNFNAKQSILLKDYHDQYTKLLDSNKILSENIKKAIKLIYNNINKKITQIPIKDKISTNYQIKKEQIEAINDEISRGINNLNIYKKLIHSENIRKKKFKDFLIRKKVFEVLIESGLTVAHAFRYPHEFSGGMRQRVGIARAIISDPKVIIADEPIAALDLSIQAQIINKLIELKEKRNLSLIFIAHDLSVVKFISSRILIIHLGRIVEFGDSQKIFKKPVHPYTINLINSMPDINKISSGFSDKQFISDYLNEYSPIVQPQFIKISENHYVLGLKEQLKKWKKDRR